MAAANNGEKPQAYNRVTAAIWLSMAACWLAVGLSAKISSARRQARHLGNNLFISESTICRLKASAYSA